MCSLFAVEIDPCVGLDPLVSGKGLVGRWPWKGWTASHFTVIMGRMCLFWLRSVASGVVRSAQVSLWLADQTADDIQSYWAVVCVGGGISESCFASHHWSGLVSAAGWTFVQSLAIILSAKSDKKVLPGVIKRFFLEFCHCQCAAGAEGYDWVNQ